MYFSNILAAPQKQLARHSIDQLIIINRHYEARIHKTRQDAKIGLHGLNF